MLSQANLLLHSLDYAIDYCRRFETHSFTVLFS